VAGEIVVIGLTGVRLGAVVTVGSSACEAVGVDPGESVPQAPKRAANTLQKYRRAANFVVMVNLLSPI